MANRDRVRRLRGQGRWAEAVELAGDDPLLRADILNEQALIAGSAEARKAAGRELDRVEARLEAERGRILAEGRRAAKRSGAAAFLARADQLARSFREARHS